MATNTPNLDLHKKDPLTDGNDYFDVNTMLNDNWDKIDSNAKVIDDRLKKVEEPSHGVSVKTSDKVSHNSDALFGKYDLTIEGQTLINELGDYGDFKDVNSDGVSDGWTHGNLASKSVSSNTQSFTANAQYGYISVLSVPYSVGDKFYAKAQLKTTSTLVKMYINDGVSQTGASSTGEGRFQTVSTMQTVASGADRCFLKFQDDRTSGWDEVQVKEALFINLTKAFGAGNEPTLAECDKRFEFFNGVRSAFEGLEEGLESVNENLFDETQNFTFNSRDDNGDLTGSSTTKYNTKPIKVKPNTTYTFANITNVYRIYYLYNGQWISRTADGNFQTFTTVVNANEIQFLTDDTQDIENIQLVEEATVPTTATKHDSQSLEIGKALQAVGVEGGLKRVSSSAFDKIVDNKLYLSINIIILDSSLTWTDYTTAITTSHGNFCAYATIDDKKIGYETILSDKFTKYNTNWDYYITQGYTISAHSVDRRIFITIPNTIVSSISELEAWLEGNKPTLFYEYEQQPDPIDLNLPIFNSFDKGTLIQSSKVPGTLIYTYPTNLGQTLKDVQDQLQDHEERLTVLDKYGSKPLDLDYTKPVEHIQANISDTPKIEITGNKLVPNLLGDDGDCNDISKWTDWAAGATPTIDSNVKFVGESSFKFDPSGTTSYRAKDITGLDISKYYLAIFRYDVTSISSGYYRVALYDVGTTNLLQSNDELVVTNNFTTKTFKFTGKDGIRMFIGCPSVSTLTAYADGMQLIEITKEDYDNLSVDELLEKYPYHNSVQPLQNPTVEVVNGDNLADESEIKVIENYEPPIWNGEKIVLDNSGNVSQRCRGNMPVHLVKGKQYTITKYNEVVTSGNSASTGIVVLDKSSTIMSAISGRTFTWENPTGVYGVSVHTDYGSLQQMELNLMLNEGATALPYTPFTSKGTVIFPTELCSENDKITWNGGSTATVEREWKKVGLDGSLDWVFGSDVTGFKYVSLTIDNNIPLNDISINPIVKKYDGSMLINGSSGVTTDTISTSNWQTSKVVISMSDTDTGWGETYTPTADEIKAYFMGWRMADTSGNPYTSGDKRWFKHQKEGYVWEPISGNDDTSLVVPSTSYVEAIPYQLFYQLSTKETEEIDVYIIGQAPIVTEGTNVVIVDSGLVYEKANIAIQTSDDYHQFNIINNAAYEDCRQAFKIKKVIDIFKRINGVETSDITNWNVNNYSPDSTFGNERWYIHDSVYDPQAEYYVLYKILDEEYNNQQVTTKLTMEDNLRDSHENLERVVADTTQEIAQTKQELLDTYLKGDGERVEKLKHEITSNIVAGGLVSGLIVFNKAFSEIPHISYSVEDTTGDYAIMLNIAFSEVTTTGFKFWARNMHSSIVANANKMLHFTAIGK